MIEWIGARIIGIFSGAFLALVFLPPRTVSGFIRRTLAALVFGWIFGPIVMDYLDWQASEERTAAAFAIAAFASWGIMGNLKKISEKIGSSSEKGE
jgi:hypothetical protein